MNVDNLRALASDEAACWKYIKELRASFSPHVSCATLTNYATRAHAFERGTRVIQDILRYLHSQRFDVRELKPGHGIGHMTRNYVHAHLLLRKLECDPGDIFIGLIVGTLHDLGCLFLNRSEEWSRVVKHAELGALVFREIFNEETFGLNEAEQRTIQYAVAAHTNFMKPQMVVCTDGVIRRSDVYHGAYFEEHLPYMAVHLPRCVDRLDLTHPLRVGRLLIEEATRYTDAYEERNKFIEAMRIGGERKKRRTNLETLNDFATSNVPGSTSPFVRHDTGLMTKQRIDYNVEMQKVIAAVASRAGYSGDESALRCSWGDFLERNLEPTELGRAATAKLFLLLNELPSPTHSAWCAGFATVLQNYYHWGAAITEELETFPASWRVLPGACDDVRDIISPQFAWPPEITGG